MFKFTRDDDTIAAGFRRIALEQIDGMLAPAKPGGKKNSAIHAVRGRAKKLRGLLRLVRPAFPDYAMENAAIRDAAARLSAARDSEALVEVFDKYLMPDADRNPTLPSIRSRLAAARDSRGDEGAESLVEFRAAMAVVRQRAERWTLTEGGFGTLGNGMRQTYRTARRRLEAARRQQDIVALHDWRKAIKSHGQHLSLLREAAPDVVASRKALAVHLGELLGDHHNLAVLRGQLTAGENAAESDVMALIDAHMQRLQDEAFELGRQMLAERPRALRRRFGAYWKSWR
ncbi:MAG TPA: CHAD domain-containing protein [Devosiaceae bacterium]|jgi:hypothetical protein